MIMINDNDNYNTTNNNNHNTRTQLSKVPQEIRPGRRRPGAPAAGHEALGDV